MDRSCELGGISAIEHCAELTVLLFTNITSGVQDLPLYPVKHRNRVWRLR